MSNSASLRKSLRDIPIFRSLPSGELSAVAASFTRKAYEKGDCLWRKGVPLDFIGIVQRGQIVIRREDGAGRHAERLKAGSYSYPPGFGDEREVAPGSAYAAAQTVVYVLHLEQLYALGPSCPTLAGNLPFSSGPAQVSRFFRRRLWGVALAILIVFLTWRDLTGVLSGFLYVAADIILPLAGPRAAIEVLDCAARVDGQAGYAYETQGYLWNQLGEERLAMEAFSRALDAAGISAPALNNLAVLSFDRGLKDQAVLFQRRASESEPNEAAITYNLGLMLLEEGDYQDAVHALREATQLAPRWASPYIHLSSVYLRMGNWADAEETARAATRLAPDQKSAHLVLALALYAQNKREQSFSSFSRAREADPEDFVARFYQAMILCDRGDYDQALYHLQQCLELCTDPGQRKRIMTEIDTVYRMQQAVSYNTQ